MSAEFSPNDFVEFQNDSDCMKRYRQCAERCLLNNFKGAIAPMIQHIIRDTQDGGDIDQADQCHDCSMDHRELQLAILLLIDSML